MNRDSRSYRFGYTLGTWVCRLVPRSLISRIVMSMARRGTMATDLENFDDPFWHYFNVADEISDVMPTTGHAFTLEDLSPASVRAARIGAEQHRLPWPPELVAAEEKLLDLREEQRRAKP